MRFKINKNILRENSCEMEYSYLYYHFSKCCLKCQSPYSMRTDSIENIFVHFERFLGWFINTRL